MIIFYIILVYETFYCIILFFRFPILIKKWDYVELWTSEVNPLMQIHLLPSNRL